MALAIIAAVGVAASLAGMGYSLSGAGQPSQPNLGASSRQMSNAEAQLLPIIRQMQATAEEGGSMLMPGVTATTQSKLDVQKQIDKLQQQIKAQEIQAGRGGQQGGSHQIVLDKLKGQLQDLQSQYATMPDSGRVVYLDKNGKEVPPDKAIANFNGMSQADIQGKIAEQMAQDQLGLSQKYDSQFIQSALDQEKLADPQSFEARQKLYDLIQQQIQNPPDSPVAKEMQRQVSDRVAAGSGLNDGEKQLLAAAVASGAADRGQSAEGADFSRDLTTGFQGEQRAMANAGAGAQWMASGQTPDDIAYRAEQQNLSNLGNFIGGRTPQSQFKELSGAQQGPTPVTTGGAPALATMDPNAGALGASSAVSRYQMGVNAALNAPNPWMAGLSGVLGIGNVAGAAGWKPLATQPQSQPI